MSEDAPVGRIKSSAYSPEIDGLRAIAVIAVVFFHLSLGFSGGYVGVDVFFVISGYLITSHILRDLTAERFSLAQFWVRRIRRIVPALAVMIGVSAIAAAIIFPPPDLKEFGRTMIAQTALVANVYFWRDDINTGGYFGTTSEERPLLHTWSLAVEEQFYIALPLVLMLLFRFRAFRNLRTLSVAIGLALLSSLGLAVYALKVYPGATFYLLPPRAWELLFGSLVACLPTGWAPRGRLVREILSWAGLAALAIPMAVYGKGTPFPGLAALPVCFGAAVLIWSNSAPRDPMADRTTAARLLSWKPLVFVGLISYSFYLWHWPIFIFSKFCLFDRPFGNDVRWLLAALSAIAAWLSWRFVEQPARRGPAWSPRRAFGFAGVLAALSLLAGGAAIFTHGFPSRFSQKYAVPMAANQAAIKDSLNDEDPARLDIRKFSLDDIRRGAVPVYGSLPDRAANSIALWGDSHAISLLPAFDLCATEANVSVYVISHSSTPPLMDTWYPDPFGLKDQAPAFAAGALDFISSHHIHNVVLTAYWSAYQKQGPDRLKEALATMVDRLAKQGCKVWIMMDVPDADMNVPSLLIRRYQSAPSDPSWHRTVAQHRALNSVLYDLKDSLPAGVCVDLAPLFLEPGGKTYYPLIDGVSIYSDSHHLTRTVALKVLPPLLREQIFSKLSPP